MSLDAATLAERSMKSRQHLSWYPDNSVLTSRHPNLVPLGSVLSFHRTCQPEASFSIHESGGPRSLEIVGSYRCAVSHRMYVVIVALTAARSRFQTTSSITVENLLESCGRLRPLYGAELAPQQCDHGLGLFEAPRLPHVDPVVVWTDDLPHPQHRGAEPVQDLRNFAVTALRHTGLQSEVATFLVREVGDGGALAVEESGGPCDRQRIERTQPAIIRQHVSRAGILAHLFEPENGRASGVLRLVARRRLSSRRPGREGS